MRDVPRRERVVAGGEVDSLVADLDGDVTVDDVEGLVLVVVDVQGRRRPPRVVGLELGEAAAGLGAAGLDGQATGLEPDVGEASASGDAIRLGEGGPGPMTPPSRQWFRRPAAAPFELVEGLGQFAAKKRSSVPACAG